MNGLSDSLSKDLFGSDEPRYDGLRLLLSRAGADITIFDLVTVGEVANGISLDRLSELSLALGLEPQLASGTLGELTLRSPLFVFETPEGDLRIFMPGADNALRSTDAEGLAVEDPLPPDTMGRALIFVDESRGQSRDAPSGPLGSLLALSGRPMAALFGLSLGSNVSGLILPFFTLLVYDQVLKAGDHRTLTVLIAGLVLGVTADAVLRIMRSRLLTMSAADLDIRMSARVLGTTLRNLDCVNLPPVAHTLGTMRKLDQIRGFLFGPVGIALLETPFLLIYGIILVFLLGWIAILPIGILIAGFVFFLIILDGAFRKGRAALARAEEYGKLCMEISWRLDTIQTEGSEHHYEQRFRDASARMAEAELLQQRTTQVLQLSTNVLVSLAVLTTLVAGSLRAMEGGTSIGALIASIALVWRMSASLPVMLQARLRWPDISEALSSVAKLFDAPTQYGVQEGSGGGRAMAGRLSFSTVSFTYERGRTPALRNVSFDTEAGELIAITGRTGAGKTTLLDLASGLLEPLAGTITIDGISPRQVTRNALRQSVAYLPRRNTALPLTINEYLHLDLDAHDEAYVAEVCERLGLSAALEALPMGLQTPMTMLNDHSGLLYGLSFARVLSSDASLILLDEPDTATVEARTRLIAELQRLKGEATVLVVTQEPSLLEIADRVMVLRDGAMITLCTPREIAQASRRSA